MESLKQSINDENETEPLKFKEEKLAAAALKLEKENNHLTDGNFSFSKKYYRKDELRNFNYSNIAFINMVSSPQALLFSDKISLKQLLYLSDIIADDPTVKKSLKDEKTKKIIRLIAMILAVPIQAFVNNPSNDRLNNNSNKEINNNEINDDSFMVKSLSKKMNNLFKEKLSNLAKSQKSEFYYCINQYLIDPLKNESEFWLINGKPSYTFFPDNYLIKIDDKYCKLIFEMNFENKSWQFVIEPDITFSITKKNHIQVYETKNCYLEVHCFEDDKLMVKKIENNKPNRISLNICNENDKKKSESNLKEIKNYSNDNFYYFNCASSERGILTPEKNNIEKYKNQLYIKIGNRSICYQPPKHQNPIYFIEAKTIFFVSLKERDKFEESNIANVMKSTLENINNTRYSNKLAIKIEKAISENSMKKPLLLLDSNIWLSLPLILYDIGDICRKTKIKIIIIKEVYDELCNIKDRESYGTIKSKKARRALSIIETFLNDKIISIDKVEAKTSKDAYADPEIIKWIKKNIKKHFIILINNDVEARTRTRSLIDSENLLILNG